MAPRSRTLSSTSAIWFAFRFGMPAAVFLALACPLVGCSTAPEEDGSPNLTPGKPNEYADPNCNSASGVSSNGGGSGVSGVCGTGGAQTQEPEPEPTCNAVSFKYEGPATSVWVTGTFNEWASTPAEGALVLTPGMAGTFELTTDIPSGEHQYKLVIDGTEWIPDPNSVSAVDDGFGSTNSVLNVCLQTCGALTDFDWRDTVMYFVMVDRFNDSDGMSSEVSGVDGGPLDGSSGQYMGGDLPGVTEKVPYLADLGVTSLWISAPYDNRDVAGVGMAPDTHQYSGYHGYWPKPANIDYSDPDNPSPTPAVESRIGNAADLKALVAAAHGADGKNGHGMKVVFDYVMNHVDEQSGLYQAHPDWFYSENGQPVLCSANDNGNWNDPFYGVRCAFTPYLPDFDFSLAAPRQWSVNDALWWAKEYGIDGYRLDAIKHVPMEWLTDLRARIQSENIDQTGDRFYLVGETYDWNDRTTLKKYVDPATKLDGQFDFPYRAKLCQAVLASGGDLSVFSSWLDGNDFFYGDGAIMTNFIGNHDIPRAIHAAARSVGCMDGSSQDNRWKSASYPQPTQPEPYERLALAFAVMFTNPGIPLVYYGDEVGLAGGGDPDNRRMMPWAGLNTHQTALRDRVTALGRIRGEHPVVARGKRTTLAATADTWVYQMAGCESAPVTVAINKSDTDQVVEIPAGEHTNLETGDTVTGGTHTLKARDFLVIQ